MKKTNKYSIVCVCMCACACMCVRAYVHVHMCVEVNEQESEWVKMHKNIKTRKHCTAHVCMYPINDKDSTWLAWLVDCALDWTVLAPPAAVAVVAVEVVGEMVVILVVVVLAVALVVVVVVVVVVALQVSAVKTSPLVIAEFACTLRERYNTSAGTYK